MYLLSSGVSVMVDSAYGLADHNRSGQVNFPWWESACYSKSVTPLLKPDLCPPRFSGEVSCLPYAF
jgi:hypothetical protein